MTDVVSEIHERGIERAKRIDAAHVSAVGKSGAHPTAALAAAFQAAGDALHAEADAATEQRKRGHQSLTKDLRNTAGRLVGIAQDLLELSKMDEQSNAITIHMDNRTGTYTPATDPVTTDLHTVVETRDAAIGMTVIDETHVIDRGRIAAYLGGETDELPTGPRTLAEAVDNAIEAENARYLDAMTPGMPDPCQPIGCDNGIHLPGCPFAERDQLEPSLHNPEYEAEVAHMSAPDLVFADPEPLRSADRWVPAGAQPYTYADLMRPVDPARFPDHWSWSQLTTLEDCGVQYRGQRLEGKPQQPQWSLIGGRAFHKVTEAFDRGAWQASGADLLPEVHPELIKQRWHDALAAEIAATATATGVEMGEHGENYRAANGGKEGYTWWLIEGEHMVEIYLHNRRKLDQAGRAAGQLRRPLMLWINEHTQPDDRNHIPVIEYAYKRKLDVPTGTLTIEGIIDRAYLCADGSILITDLKTGRLPNQTGQLGEYAWTLLELLGMLHFPEHPIIRGNFYDARRGLFTDPVNLLERHPREEYVYRYGAADAARRMGVFLPHRSTFCAGCSIRWACPVGGA